MNENSLIIRTKNDYKDLQNFLKRNELIDERNIWFAGYDNYRKATQNAIAGNLLYGNSKLVIMCIKNNEVYFLNNSRKGFNLRVIGNLENKNKVSSLRHILYPVVDFTGSEGKFYSVKVTKNKDAIKDFKNIIKHKI